MIPFDFSYHKPANVGEALETFNNLTKNNLPPVYYSGGTEIISFARLGKITFPAVIDIKGIPETGFLGIDSGYLKIGSTVTLNCLVAQDFCTPLKKIAERVADYTIRNRLTLGGNLCGRLPYREALLPLLLLDCTVLIAGPGGIYQQELRSLFNKRLLLKPGELLLSLQIPEKNLNPPFAAFRYTRFSEIDYPLAMTLLIKKGEEIHGAVTGLSNSPCLLDYATPLFTDCSLSKVDRAEKIATLFPNPIREDYLGSAEYRLFLFKKALAESLRKLEE